MGNGRSRFGMKANQDMLVFMTIASSAYHFAMNFVANKLVTKLEQFSPEDVRADISALKAFVNKSLKTLSANTKENSHHQDNTNGVVGLPVQVGRINTVSSLGLAKGVLA